MDTNAGANQMIRIDLGKEGKFLSGRSRAGEIVGKLESTQIPTSSIEIDFNEVESCSQSFISELVFRLKEHGARKGSIKALSIADSELETRLNAELHRLEMI